MVEDDGVEVSTVVVLDEVISGVGYLEAPGPQRLLLQQCLVQRKDHLQRTDGCGQQGLHKNVFTASISGWEHVVELVVGCGV